MNEKFTASQLADALSLTFPGNFGVDKAAAELRRLSTVNAELLEALNDMLNAENSYPYGGMSESEIAAIGKSRAAIARATEE